MEQNLLTEATELEAPPAPTGPTGPQRNIDVPEERLPTIQHKQTAELFWVGVHGGAGESTLSMLVSPSWQAADHAWPLVVGKLSRVILCCRSHVSGLLKAKSAITEWAAGAVPCVELIGLVIVADAPGRLPRPIRDLIKHVSGGAPCTWQVPWVESWRLGEDVDLARAPGEVQKLANDLRVFMKRVPAMKPAAASSGHNRKE